MDKNGHKNQNPYFGQKIKQGPKKCILDPKLAIFGPKIGQKMAKNRAIYSVGWGGWVTVGVIWWEFWGCFGVVWGMIVVVKVHIGCA